MEFGFEFLGIRFSTGDAGTLLPVEGVYLPWLAASACVLAFLGIYVGLVAMSQIAGARTTAQKSFWLGAGAIAMGGGIWSMHFIGLVAYSLPVEVKYDPALTILSVIPAVAASAIVLSIFSRTRTTAIGVLTGAVLWAAGICVMHFMGLAAIRADLSMVYDPYLLGASIAIALIGACGALALKPKLEDLDTRFAGMWTNVVAASIFGVAVIAMHYLAMYAVTFNHCESCASTGSGAGHGLLTFGTNVFVLLAITLLLNVVVMRRKSADAALLNAIYGSSLEGLVVVDRCGVITMFSVAAERIFGYRSAEVLGKNVAVLMPDAMRDVHAAHVANYKPTAGSDIMANNPEVTALKKDGTEFPVDIIVTRISTGHDLKFAATIRDITVRKEAELAMKRAHEEVEEVLRKQIELNEVQRQFVAMASHEFRTPLAIIDSAAQRLLRHKDNLSPEDVFDRLERIRSSVQRLSDMMERTLSAERIHTGNVSLRLGDHSLRDIVLNAAKRQHEIDRTHSIACDLEGLHDTICCDERALEQVFNNLIANAVKYSPDSPNIVVSGRRDGDHVVISIEDSGLGIGEKDMPRIFERYFRAATSAGIVGTGIGLNLAKLYVVAHGGEISVQSKQGEGSTFTIRLPVAGPAETQNIQEEAA